MKGLRVTKSVKAIRFEGSGASLESGRGFQGRGLAGCLRLTLVFVWDSAQWERFSFCFSRVFC